MNKLIISIFYVILLCACAKEKPVVFYYEPVNAIEQPLRYDLNLIAAGDNLFHDTINKSSKNDDTYDFYPIYSEIKSIITSYDLAFINQETVMAGVEYGYSGYPAFNTPQVLAQTIIDTGFSIINLANNHAMDMGAKGLISTLELFNGLTVIGAQDPEKEQHIITKNNITLGLLSYTFSLNGNALPKDKPNLVSLIDREIIAEETAALRPLCDFLVISVHWGEEYLLIEPDAFQTDLALFFAEQNADLIIGHHPHVLQKFERIARPDGKFTYCIYSLGNFVSNQTEKARALGGLLHITFTKIGDVSFISDYGLLPVICHFDKNLSNTKVYPFYAYTEELLKDHYIRLKDAKMTLDFYKEILNNLNIQIFAKNRISTE
jgi:poly-gamma-glutamate synthesis protein (capsule biosynthesis protein)